MSTELIRSITTRGGKFTVFCASSNVSPRTYSPWEDEKASELLKTKGLAAALKRYGANLWNGYYKITGTQKTCAALKYAYETLARDEDLRGFLDDETAGGFIAGMAASCLENTPWDVEEEMNKLQALRSDFQAVMEMGKSNVRAFQFASDVIQSMQPYALTYTKAYADSASFEIPKRFNDDYIVVTEALLRNGCLYRQLPEKMKADKDIIRLAFMEDLTLEDGTIRRFHEHLPDLLPEEQQKNVELLEELLIICPSLHADRLQILFEDYHLACVQVRHNRWVEGRMDRFPKVFLEQKVFQLEKERGDELRTLRQKEREEKQRRLAEQREERAKQPKMKVFNVTICCTACYNGSIEVPESYSREEALEYARDLLPDIPLGELEYIPNSDELDDENCDFEED